MADITTTTGPHTGWTRHEFVARERPWTLLLIDNDQEKRSQLSPRDEQRVKPWPCYHIMSMVGVLLTVEAAATIIERVYDAYESGKQVGAAAARYEVRKAIGA